MAPTPLPHRQQPGQGRPEEPARSCSSHGKNICNPGPAVPAVAAGGRCFSKALVAVEAVGEWWRCYQADSPHPQPSPAQRGGGGVHFLVVSPAQPSPAQPSPAQPSQERERQDFCDAGLTRGQRQHLYTLQHNITLVIMLCSLSCTFIDIRYFYTCLCAFDFCYVTFSVSIAATRTEHCSFSGFLYILI